MATLAMVRAQFPEANNVSDILVTTMLAAAALEIHPAVWGVFGAVGGPMTKADQGQMYLAMHKLSVSPFGQNARTQYKAGSGRLGYETYSRTTYGQEFLNLRTSVTSGFRVA